MKQPALLPALALLMAATASAQAPAPADPAAAAPAFTQLQPNGNRGFWSRDGGYQSDHNFDGAGGSEATFGRFISVDSYGPTWNNGSFRAPDGSNRFLTHSSIGLQLNAGSNSSGIGQGIGITFQHYGYNGDSSPFYIDDNYIPGSATGGSDEGHAGTRINSIPNNTFTALVSADRGNIRGTSAIRFTQPGNCGGSGSPYAITTCLGAGGWLMDKSDPLLTGLHMASFTPGTDGATAQHPTLIRVAETLKPGVFVTSKGSLSIGPMYAGDTVKLPVALPAGFNGPYNGNACVSGPGGNTAEEMLFTLSGTTLTLTGHRFPHNAGDGVLLVGLQSCAVAVWTQDAADNGTGSTAYVVLGVVDPHTVAVAAYNGSARVNGTIDRNLSIRPDGGRLGAFTVYPAALIVDVTDPAYQPEMRFSPKGFYAFGPLYAHLATNTVPWAAGKAVEEGYNPADTYALHRESCWTPLGNIDNMSSCSYLEIRGSVQRANEYVLTNFVDVAARRGAPDIFLIRPYNFSGKLGTYHDFVNAAVAPTNGWLKSVYYCGESLFDASKCPDHSLWEEGGFGKINLSGKDNTMTFALGAHDPRVAFRFNQGLEALTVHARNGFSGTCASNKIVFEDGVAVRCAP